MYFFTTEFGQSCRTTQTKTAPEGAAFDYLVYSYAFLHLTNPIELLRQKLPHAILYKEPHQDRTEIICFMLSSCDV